MTHPSVAGDAAQCVLIRTEFDSYTQSTGWESKKTVWGSFADAMIKRAHPEFPDKHAVPLWAPIKLRPNSNRANANVLEVYALVLDIDHADAPTVVDVERRLCEDGLAYLAHTTHSHNPDGGDHRWRIVVPLAEPVLGRAWPNIWRAAVARYSPKSDQQCKDVARQYFYPSTAPGQSGRHSIYAIQGRPLSTDMLGHLELVSAAPAASQDTRAITREVLEELGKRWRRDRDPRIVDLGTRVPKILSGVSFAEPGERDTAVFALCGALVRQYPDCDPQSVGQLLRLSLGVMGDGAPTPEQVADKIARCKRYQVESETNRANESINEHQRAVALAFRGSGRTDEYSAAELKAISDTLGISLDELDQSWIVQNQSDYYILGPGPRYDLAKRESLINTARISLAPAPVSLYHDGKLVGVDVLLQRCSHTVQNVVRSLVAQTPSVDIPNNTLRLPTCPRRALTAQRSQEIEDWLILLGGDNCEALLDWLALATDLANPTSALVLIGKGGAGKSLLAMGLSRIWCTTGPTSIDDAMGTFNDPLERCPIVFADEKLPRDFRGNVRSEELRRLVQETSRQSNRKNRAQCPLEGAIRLLIAANNEAIFDMRDHLTQADIQAIADRFLQIDCTLEPYDYLQAIGRHRIQTEWLDGDALAKHILWLVANRRVTRRGRFGIHSDTAGIAERITVRSGVRAAICEWIVKSLTSGTLCDDGGRCIVRDGRLWLHVSVLSSDWGKHMTDSTPKTSQLTAALQGLTVGQIEVARLPLYEIDVQRLKTWATEQRYCSPELIEERLK